jgi:hypothetical protein
MNEEKGMKAGWMTMPLAFVATFAFLFAVGTSGAGPDADDDGDGLQNNQDNCDQKVNVLQTDSDQDGYGNACDGDYTNDGIVGGPDFTVFAGAFNAKEGEAEFNPDVDSNDDGIIGGPDFTVFAAQFTNDCTAPGTGGPGPSGLSCTAACGTASVKRCPPSGILIMPRAAALP